MIWRIGSDDSLRTNDLGIFISLFPLVRSIYLCGMWFVMDVEVEVDVEVDRWLWDGTLREPLSSSPLRGLELSKQS